MKRLVLCCLVAIGLAACARNVGNLQRAAASLIVPTPPPDSTNVSNVSRGATSVKWVATAPNGDVYDCSADDQVARGPSGALHYRSFHLLGESTPMAANVRAM